ncbi:hypothetical protein BOTNAR_0466g00120 [Botryotinia narcissicola]|uniref:Uncharacterized protein n=1 Tax=Botryotinia narcissicola TaxID=278944 RepID=A0A4Z1HHX9_9HELO|nr:hypothetical protein BOTNAR_0466g00120 [Botryotinia narcissicola]
MSVLFSAQKALGAEISLAIDTNFWRHMPRESAEKLFVMLPMKTQSQGVSTTLVAALNPKIAAYGPCTNVFEYISRKLPNLAPS